MRKKTLILAAVLFLAAAFGNGKRDMPEASVPRLADLPSRRMLVLSAQGDPSKAAGPAFERLYKAFYARAARSEKRHAPAPRARWAASQLDSAKEAWIGSYGIPVSDAFPLPDDKEMRIENWEYGLTAEILHLGPYGDEAEDIAALKRFISANGLAIRGPHEEEYVKGPGMLFKGNPAKYRTWIRYPVARIGEMPQPLAGPAGENRGQPAR